ncbi:hypothetical protein GYMLUDRAFT_47485 [Collybiopsis luxurians FD-317 M1]|uniref:Rhomboid-type serine protease n=1 Tax=Collybiopsis luxurians FD-317 M1 TaxID=944289 RepID=A0A0D0CL32_9AGAR|nr:hypothetical protein GYMLUDRAFT_47485 [Collybiopsis luxurians FD-317 M1]
MGIHTILLTPLIPFPHPNHSPYPSQPTVNPMLGPSASALPHLRAHFTPYIENVSSVPTSTFLVCVNDTVNPSTINCPLEEICGFNGFSSSGTPTQWFRFFAPIFLHAGFIHISLNLLAQLTVSAQVEREMGSGGCFIVDLRRGFSGMCWGGIFRWLGCLRRGRLGRYLGRRRWRGWIWWRIGNISIGRSEG